MLARLREAVCEANLELAARGLVTYTWGNVSGIDRDSGTVAIKPSGVDYDALTAADIVLLDLLSGKVIWGDLRPSSDTPTHLALYRAFAGVGGVAHTHSPSATAFAQAGLPLPCLGTTHADHFHGDVPVTRMLTAEEVGGAYEANTGGVIVETFSGRDPLDVPAVLVAGHGPFTWGETAAAAVKNSVVLEAVAEMGLGTLQLRSSQRSIPQYLMERHYRRKHGPGAYYGQR